ncbi:type II and III secretion system protein family protein [Novosphingobium sp.]|uniref:type II and III secretion system protein family protein n=1 Tax=Novosphingobium sp. TaxID=1874826 RepID=UPI0025D02CE1|nr:type II and III secretion system protein family protein [Novosphingobium sp.]
MATDRIMWRAAFSAAALLSATALSCAVAFPAAAQSRPSIHAGTLEVPLNKSEVLNADRPIAKAMIGNDKVADILPISDRSIYVLGKAMGTTSLTLYDGAGRVISVMDVAVGPDVESLTRQISELVPGENINAKISNESVVLTGMVNNPGAIDRAVQLAKSYAGDKVINLISLGSSQQVMLEVKFAEVSRQVGKEIGVGFGAADSVGKFTGVIGKGASTTAGALATAPLNLSTITDQFGVFRNNFSIGGVGLSAFINGLESKGMAKTLAQPTLLALSGEKASFLAGGEFPIPVAQSGGAGAGGGNQAITVEFKQFGVSLGFTPTVLGDKTINLIVEPEVSAIDPAASFTVGNITVPGLRTRRASTTLELRDGESFAIAGLLSRDFQTTVNQVPLLGSIPILGALFRSTNFKKGETELLIVVTPHLVAPIRPDQVRLPTDRVKDPNELETFLMGQPYHPQALPPAGPSNLDAGGSAATAPAAPSAKAGELPPAADQPKKDSDYAY